jgi:rubredoxin
MTLWKCQVCGMIVEGDNPPVACPKCGAPAEKFTKMTDEETKKIAASDRTNDIHIQIIGLAMEIAKLAEEGIAINLDPPCVSVFNKAKDEAWIIKQRSKAEIVGHISKGKW